jgi:hypothetical protein
VRRASPTPVSPPSRNVVVGPLLRDLLTAAAHSILSSDYNRAPMAVLLPPLAVASVEGRSLKQPTRSYLQ